MQVAGYRAQGSDFRVQGAGWREYHAGGKPLPGGSAAQASSSLGMRIVGKTLGVDVRHKQWLRERVCLRER